MASKALPKHVQDVVERLTKASKLLITGKTDLDGYLRELEALLDRALVIAADTLHTHAIVELARVINELVITAMSPGAPPEFREDILRDLAHLRQLLAEKISAYEALHASSDLIVLDAPPR